MQKIKFSHRYFKMPENFSDTMLLQVFTVPREELGIDFVGYDVTWENPNGDVEEYPLPKGMLLVLLLASFVNGREVLWTTIRRWMPTKELYYRGLIGEKVQIVIEEENVKITQ